MFPTKSEIKKFFECFKYKPKYFTHNRSGLGLENNFLIESARQTINKDNYFSAIDFIFNLYTSEKNNR